MREMQEKKDSPEALAEKEAKGRQARRMQEEEENPNQFRLMEKMNEQQYRLHKVDKHIKRGRAFLDSICNDRIYFCNCWHRKIHETQVKAFF